MSFFEDLKNTKVTDAAFYLMFILALIAPGTAYAMVFHLEVFKELDSWKAILMVVAIGAPLFVITTATTYITNHRYFEGEDGLKILGFYSCLNVLSSPYVVLVLAVDQKWSFLLTSAVAFLACMVGGAVIGGASRI
ncbi:hypothetical protein RCF34_20660 [Pseudomonas sp. 102515]|uniref:hypothetical protein n=1 Tax=Pseudomonas sp. 102515 TaxID=3071568 RepID=UPI002802B5AE|nr:hypothetical protein [Pseudomonas sp. 102515]MDQ7915526.1 hypothetical protein [Pseudomonas sp. 102515]